MISIFEIKIDDLFTALNQLAETLLSINENLNQPLNSTGIPTVEAEVTQFSTSTPSLSNSHGNRSGSSYKSYKKQNQNRQGVGHEQGLVERVKELESSMKYNQNQSKNR